MYQIIEVPPDAFDLPEQLGTKRKFWYRDRDNRLCLFKEGRPNTGENWAEKICCELCRLIGVPHAEYDLATWRDYDGVITPTFVPKGSRLVLGNELLEKLKGYPHRERYRVRQHTLNLVVTIMERPPIGVPLNYGAQDPIRQAVDVFIGYLMIDALVANQDRHHENWGLIISPERKITLAPTFDHASSLGRNETDEVRKRRLTTTDQGGNVERYCDRARSAFYLSPKADKPLSTFDAFREAAKSHPEAAAYWLERLGQTSNIDYGSLFENIPPSAITQTAIQFALRMLDINRNRLLRTEL